MALIDSSVEFTRRVEELGLKEHVVTMASLGVTTFAELAFCTDYTPGDQRLTSSRKTWWCPSWGFRRTSNATLSGASLLRLTRWQLETSAGVATPPRLN